jgi:hypothetical protein
LCEALVNDSCAKGLLLVVDELGKTLEFTARQADSNLFALQELAELAARSGIHPFLVVGVLHQSFDQYGEHLGASVRREWAKVQGRFSDIAFFEPPEQQMRLAARVVGALEFPSGKGVGRLTEIAKAVGRVYCPPGLKPQELIDLSIHCYPLHLTVLVALPYLFRCFAQNERSLYAYLLSQEPLGLQDLWRSRGAVVVRLPDLFDYLIANLAGTLRRHPFARRWFEVTEILERERGLDLLESQAVKTIGILGVLAEFSSLKASSELISLALSDKEDCPRVGKALAALRNRSLIVYRRFNSSYRVWEGSDLDLDALVEEGRRKTAGALGLAASLSRYLQHRPLVARRHSYETGALRFFNLVYLDEPSVSQGVLPSQQADATIICCLPSSLVGVKGFIELAESREIASRVDLVAAIPNDTGNIREASRELQALQWVWENTPELRGDHAARRELTQRTATLEHALTGTLGQLLDPRQAPIGTSCAWFYRGEHQALQSPAGVTQFLSSVMDRIYPESPRIRNELINRRNLSSAAVAARRCLIERMLLHSDRSMLAIEGFPAERSMYESVLLASGLHQEREPGKWRFGPSSVADPLQINPLWEKMTKSVFESTPEPVAVDQLFKQLVAPPYGGMPGVLPVLLCAFLLANRDETSLYREGTFIPEPLIADFELLIRRPDLFAVAGVRLEGQRAEVVQRLAEGWQVHPGTVPVVRELIRAAKALPDYAWQTSRLPEGVKAVREAFQRARSPERFLFIDLPGAMGVPSFAPNGGMGSEQVRTFFDRLNTVLAQWAEITPNRITGARDALLSACGLPPSAAGWAHFRCQAQHLEGKSTDPMLVAVIRRAVKGDEQESVEGVLALISGCPPSKWTDVHEERFREEAASVGQRFAENVRIHSFLSAEEEALSLRVAALIRRQLPPGLPFHVIRAAIGRLLDDSAWTSP